MKWLPSLCLSAACVALSLPIAPAAEQKKEENDAQTIVFLGDRAPVVIRVHLRVDGKSHREAWSKLVDGMFDYLDVDRNGELSKREAAASPPPGALVGPAFGFGFGGGTRPDLDADRDGKVTRAEFRDHYYLSGLMPFQIGSQGPNLGRYFVRIGGGSEDRPSAEALNARVFALLDTDKDGKLSKKELEAAPAVLGKLDRDEDEMLTPAEVAGRAERGNSGGVVLPSSPAPAVDSPFVRLADGKTDAYTARRILSHYGKLGKKKLDAKKLGLTKLDLDEDGWLGVEELSRMRDVPADLEIIIRLGKRDKGEKFVEVGKKGKSLKKLESTGDSVVMTIDNARIELRGPEERKDGARLVPPPAAQSKARFEAADTDKNGYLDKQEAEASRFFRGQFPVMDRDGDGKLYLKEVAAFEEQMARFRAMTRKGCASLVMRDEGKGLFDLIDADGDGRLSVRELSNAAKVLLKLDIDGDGKLTTTEVPRNFRGSFEQGPTGVEPAFGAVAVRLLTDSGGPPPPARTKGPLWFRKMDRNRDGDVSKAEWLGTAKQFVEIDTDNDGLIGLEEAEAYDRAKRAKE